MSTYTDFKSNVMERVIGDGQCVALVVNNSSAYVEALYPGVNWTTIIAPVTGAREMAYRGNQYLTWIPNDVNDPNQLPLQGDIMIFDATPKAGYTNTYYNPYGHTGICDSADSSGYNLLQQNSPGNGSPVNVTRYTWKFRPCLGWYHPTNQATPTPQPPVYSGQTLYLAPDNNDFHLYPVGGPYNPKGYFKGWIAPRLYGGLTYKIVANRGNGIYTINTQMYGQGDVWTQGSDIKVS